MEKDRLFSDKDSAPGGFEFNTDVARVFDDMLTRSIPLYTEQQRLIATVARQFYIPGTKIIDLGCSTGTTLINLANGLPDSELVGFDASQPMLDQASDNLQRAGVADRVALRQADLNADLNALDFSKSSVVTLCWTLQFIRPLKRDALIRKIYDNLAEGGVLIVTEKVLTNNSHMNRFFIDFYYDFKRANGYSDDEINRKREALENVLIAYRLDENIELFHRNGFQTAETFFQWFNFAGILCVKLAT